MDRVKSLENVKVKTIAFELENGDVVYIPGPFAYCVAAESVSTDGIEEEEESSNLNDSDSDSDNSQKFVARNEFGHIRFQNFLSQHQNKVHHATELVGGHCVLPPSFFKECIAKGWGSAHPFAGRYHPIVGTVIPETTLVFKAPRDAVEAQVLWEILHASYLWAAGKIEA